eukprot:snap_masked-scaffold_19-processed-gene-1.39-mRNA-1 protein AED:1.00 eAED:1.00 QI:0/-1/0/0/-1/1/1/0/135
MKEGYTFIEQLVLYSPGQKPSQGHFVEHFDTKYLICRRNKISQHSFDFYKRKDVAILTDSKEKELYKLFREIFNTQELMVDAVTIKNETIKISKLEVTPLNEIDTLMADELAELVDQQRDVKSILIKNMLDRIPD